MTEQLETREDRIDHLTHRAERVEQAQAALNDAERDRRVQAMIEVRAKQAGIPGALGKTDVASTLGISRPTLDAWLTLVESTPDEMESVEDAERSRTRFLERNPRFR